MISTIINKVNFTFDWLDTYGGLAFELPYYDNDGENRTEKIAPASFERPIEVNCVDEELLPDVDKKAIAFWLHTSDITHENYKYSTTAKLVLWMNPKKMGYNTVSGSLAKEVIKRVQSVTEFNLSGVDQVQTTLSLFKSYGYGSENNLFVSPYEILSINFDIDFSLGCFECLELKDEIVC